MNRVKFAFLGATKFGEQILKHLISRKHIPEVIFTIPEEFNISYSDSKVKISNPGSFEEIANKLKVPLYEVDSVTGKRVTDYEQVLQDHNIEVLIVMGWYYMIPRRTRELVKYGAWGIHASLLPAYAGGAPLNWAIINGEKKTGVTLFRMDDGVDDGDIISQKEFDIRYDDCIRSVYEKATEYSKDIIVDALNNADAIEFIKQDKDNIKVYPQRKPSDGEIDLNMSSNDMYNFIRAQSSPYPGAYIKTTDGKKLIIEKARVEDLLDE